SDSEYSGMTQIVCPKKRVNGTWAHDVHASSTSCVAVEDISTAMVIAIVEADPPHPISLISILTQPT
ncbi:hypothetical protein FRB98_001892, partial [Tulasnella sp. 332]